MTTKLLTDEPASYKGMVYVYSVFPRGWVLPGRMTTDEIEKWSPRTTLEIVQDKLRRTDIRPEIRNRLKRLRQSFWVTTSEQRFALYTFEEGYSPQCLRNLVKKADLHWGDDVRIRTEDLYTYRYGKYPAQVAGLMTFLSVLHVRWEPEPKDLQALLKVPFDPEKGFRHWLDRASDKNFVLEGVNVVTPYENDGWRLLDQAEHRAYTLYRISTEQSSVEIAERHRAKMEFLAPYLREFERWSSRLHRVYNGHTYRGVSLEDILLNRSNEGLWDPPRPNVAAALWAAQQMYVEVEAEDYELSRMAELFEKSENRTPEETIEHALTYAKYDHLYRRSFREQVGWYCNKFPYTSREVFQHAEKLRVNLNAWPVKKAKHKTYWRLSRHEWKLHNLYTGWPVRADFQQVRRAWAKAHKKLIVPTEEELAVLEKYRYQAEELLESEWRLDNPHPVWAGDDPEPTAAQQPDPADPIEPEEPEPEEPDPTVR